MIVSYVVCEDRIHVVPGYDFAKFHVSMNMKGSVYVILSEKGKDMSIVSPKRIPERVHEIKVSNLKPGVTYDYSVFNRCELNTLKVIQFGSITTGSQ